MSLPTVIRLPRLEDDTSFALLHISSAGRKPLDLSLIGTDEESVFSVSLKHKDTSSLRWKKYKGTQEELDHVISSVLLGEGKDEATRGIEAVARLDDDHLIISIQMKVEGITQKYAEIKLPETPEVELSLFDWCRLTIQRGESAALEAVALRKRLQEKESEAQLLQDELAKLAKDKTDNENSLLEKFSLLLNEKKLKIRDQQRMLATASVDPARAEAIEQDRSNAKSRSPGPSRKGKRKVVKDESDESDGFEQMDVDVKEPDNGSDDDGQQTPDEESTADEASDDEPPPPPPPTKKTVNQAKGKASNAGPSTEDTEPIPPPRELPFGMKKAAAPKAKPSVKPAAAPVEEGSETESDDDEL